jgi:hypothetical protein
MACSHPCSPSENDKQLGEEAVSAIADLVAAGEGKRPKKKVNGLFKSVVDL